MRNLARLAAAGAASALTLNWDWTCARKARTYMYLWGNGQYQAQPGRVDAFANFTPKRITHAIFRADPGQLVTEFPLFEDVVASPDVGFGLTGDGRIFVFDNFKLPSAESNDPNYYIETPQGRVAHHHVLHNLADLGLGRKAKKIALTQEFLWAVDERGDLHQLRVLSAASPSFSPKDWRRVPTISGLDNISAGDDHVLMLKTSGEVFAMGDDTYGQCGVNELGRSQSGPFVESRVSNPKLLPALAGRRVTRMWSGPRHNFVETAEGDLVGFGSNSHLQLAHEQQYATAANPLLAVYNPRSFRTYLDQAECNLKDVALGEDFSLFVCENRVSKASQVWGTGVNLKGQIPISINRHLINFQKVENLSEFFHTNSADQEVPIDFRLLSCGRAHCAALTSTGLALLWGDNEFGQLANKRRSFSTTPLIISPFKQAIVRRLKATGNSCFAVVEEPEPGENTQARDTSGKTN